MSFLLQVKFTGLCLYLEHTDRKKIAVLQPDCRTGAGIDMEHEDGTFGVPHVGYMRFDLANVVADIPAGTADTGPKYEGVYRFDRQEIDFGIAPSEDVTTGAVELPRFEMIAHEADGSPLLEPLPGLFSKNPISPPPDALLMRTILHGGNLTGKDTEYWKFSRLFSLKDRKDSKTYTGGFKSVTTWTRRVDDDTLTITIRDFDQQNPVKITFKPVTEGGTVTLKVANLCSENPLEWRGLDLRTVTGDDEDFKWLYRLMQPKKDGERERTYEELLMGGSFPIPMQTTGGLGREDCFGGVLSGQVFP